MSRAWLWLGLLVAFTGSAKELVLVDAELAPQIQEKPGVEFRRLHGLDDLPGALAGDRWSRVSLISHGQPGALQLGKERLDQDFLAAHPDFLTAWRHQLTADAQLELWGCEVAKGQGHLLVDSLSTAVGRPVLASTDATGPSRLGGNLTLEYGQGLTPDNSPLATLRQLLLTSADSLTFEGYASIYTLYSSPQTFGSFTFYSNSTDTTPSDELAVGSTFDHVGNRGLYVVSNNVGEVTQVRIAGASTFKLNSIWLGAGAGDANVTLHAYRSNTEIGTGRTVTLSNSSINTSSYNEFNNIDELRITGTDLDLLVDNIMIDAPGDSDGGLMPDTGTEPISIATTAGATAALDFKLTDGGTSDNLAMTVSEVRVHVSGTSTDAERGNVAWTLTGPDITGSVTGTYSGGVITFATLPISVADHDSETYTVKADLGHGGLIEGHTFLLSLDGDTDLALDSAGTRMASTSAVDNGAGFATSVTASQLAFTTQPDGSTSGSALTTQPVVAAQDSFGNTDTGFTGDISLSEASAGTLSGTNTVAASSGVAIFSGLVYTATADQEAFSLNAAASGLTGATANSVISNVVATKLLFNTQPAPTSLSSGGSTSFSTVPVLKAVDANNTVDTGYNTNMVLSVSNTSGGAVAGTVNSLTATGDTDGSATTVTLTPTSGSATFSGLGLNYTNAGISDSLALRATSGTLSAAISSTLTSVALPTVTDAHISISGASGTGGAFKVGDTVTATWNNTSGGDNNSGITGVTVDFSQFGGGAAVAASNSGETWSATYIITSGSIDATNRNVSVSATNVNGTRTTADGSNASVDNQAPTISDANIALSGASGTGGAFKIGDTVTATWNNTAGGDNNSDTISSVSVNFTQFGGGSAVGATNSSGTWTATYTLTAGAIDATNRNVSITANDNASNSTTTADTSNAIVDNVAPTVTNVAVPANSTYTTGQSFDFRVNFDDVVNVTGTPRLAVMLGSSGVYASYVSGDGSSALTFRYTVQAGDNDSDGISVGALSANGGTLKDDNGNNAILTLNSVGSTSSVLVDTTAPTVTSVTVPGNSTYITGQNLDFTVNFSKVVMADTSGGTPRLALMLGSSTVYADYLSGSGTSALTFRHTVQAGENDADGIAVGAMSLNGGSLTDTVGNGATLTLNSVGTTTSVLVDTSAPTVSSVAVPGNGTYVSGQSLDFTVNFAEVVTVTGTPRLALTLGSSTVYADYLSGSGTSALTFRHTVQAGENDADGIAVGTLGLNSGTIKDAVGNDATLTLNSVGDMSAVLVDTTAPTVGSVAVPANGTYTTNQHLNFTVNFNEPVTVDTSGGTPRLALTLGSSTVYADYLSGSGSSALTFRHTVQAGENDADGIAVGTLGLNSGTLKDAVGNDATLTLNSVSDMSAVLVDTTAPTVSSVAVPDNGTYVSGQNQDFTVNFDEAVMVDTSGGIPRLALTLGSSTVYADYLSGSSSSALTFRHTVQAGENDADGIAVGTLSLNSSSIKDAAGNNATLVLNSVGSTSSVLVDTTAPTVSSVAVPGNSTYITGQNLDFTVNFSKVVMADTSGGTPRLALTLGSSTVYASYVSGSGTSALIFSYTVETGKSDSDGITVGPLSLNGGTLRDAVGNDATLTLNSVASAASVLVDGIAPTLSSSSPADDSTSMAFDANVQLVLSEAITAGSGNLAIYDAADDSLVEANAVGSSRVTISGNTVMLDPLADLMPSHSYYLQVGAQALLDAAGNAYAGISDKTSLNFTVANVAPVAAADSTLTQEDSAVQVDVTANDSDADSALNKASVTVVTAAQHGTTSVDTGTGVITYTPVANYNGNDSFTYRVQDIYGTNSNVVTVSATVQPVNDAPQAVADIGSTTEDAALTIDVLANDSDIDSGDSLNPATLSLVTSPAHGTAQISNGQVSYTPAVNFNGSDSFSYTIADQYGGTSNVATVIINVGSSNDAPIAANDNATTDEDSAVVVDALGNDSDLDGTLVPASVVLLQQPAHGQVSVNGLTGALTYSPAVNYNGQDSFSYAVEDNEGATSNAASVTMTVHSINDAPVAVNNSVSLQEDASLSINVLGNDSDVDGTLVPSSAQLVSQPAHGTATVNNADGSILYTPASNAVGEDSFTYRVEDDQGSWSNVATVAMTIQSVNDAPLANADQSALDEDSALTLHLLDNDSDIDGSLQDVYIVAQPASGSLDVGSSGEVTYTPAANFHGSDVFSYQAVDNEGARSPSAVVTLTVRAVNDAPTITGNGAASLLEGSRYHFTPVINDVDGDELTVTVSGLPVWLTMNSHSGELSGTPIVGQAGQYDAIVLTVSDGTAQSALPAFALTVQADLDGDGLANSVDVDDDNDGMSDGYEDDHDFNPLDPTDATTDADQDGVSNQQESVDGTNPHNVNDYLDTTAPVVSAVADVTVDATGRFTPITVRKLLGLADTVSDDEVATELRALSSDNIDGAACCSVTIDGMTDNQLMLAPGRHEVIYQATDRKGNVGTVTQLVRVRPLVSMSKDQVAVPGQSLSFSIILNGPAPDYPFTVPYALDDSSTLSTDKHSLQAGSVTFTSGQTALTVPVTLRADAAASGNQTLVVRLDDQTSDELDLAGGYDPAAPDSHDINAGAKRSHVITVTTGNVAPQVDLSLQQNGQQTMLVTPSGGSVTVSATVLDPNATDTHTFDWSGTSAEVVDTDGNLTDAALVFDPSGLAEGVYPVQVTVTDSQGAAAVRTLYFRLVANLPELAASADTDGDGISDQEEGVADSDDDGIVDYLDNLSASNLLPEALATTAAFVMECDPGVLCRLGQYALQNGASGSRLLASDLASLPSMRQDSSFTPVGGIFDFEIADLPTAGQSVSVVIPLGEVIPVNAVYRKFQNGQWRTFVEDDNNQLHSAPGSLGYCPPPGDTQWATGLTAGDYCVQLTLEDGGPNDADGVVNASIADPGAVSVSTADDSGHDGSGSFGGAALLALWALQRYRRCERAKLRH